MHEREVVECKNFSCCFTNVDSTTVAFPAILKMFYVFQLCFSGNFLKLLKQQKRIDRNARTDF